MNIENADTLNGNDPARQMMILATHSIVLLGAFIGMTLFQLMLFTLSGHTRDGIDYVSSGNFVPITFLMTAFFGWWYLPKGFVNPQANRIQATDNMWSRSQFQDGSTQFIVYQAGIALKYAWERLQGRQIEVEMEKALECEEISITIKKIALEIKLRGIWRVWIPRLSAFLQNAENGSAVILKQLQAEINQTVESYASMFADTEQVRMYQHVIVEHALNSVQQKYRHYGINLLDLKFQKCDYSKKTQEELNKLLELRSIEEVASGIVDMEKFRLAAAAAGKPGVKVSQDIRRFEMTPEFAEALGKMGPAGAILMGLNQQGGGDK